MSQEKHYDYYVVNAEESAAAHTLYKETIQADRAAAHQKMLGATGAIAWRECTNWGKPDYIAELVFPADSPLIAHPHVKQGDRERYNGDLVVSVRGKLNSKAGKEFNKHMDEANKQLAELPDFPDWLVHKRYNVNRTGLGGPIPGRAFGTAMLSTSGGFANDKCEQLVFRIPNDKCDNHGTVEIPPCFEKITYGQWYDLVGGET